MTRYGMTLLTVGLVLVVSQTKADDKEDKAKLQGEWSQVSWELNGQSGKGPDDKVKFEGNKSYATSPGSRDDEWTFAIDSSKKPKWIDLTAGGQVAKGIL